MHTNLYEYTMRSNGFRIRTGGRNYTRPYNLRPRNGTVTRPKYNVKRTLGRKGKTVKRTIKREQTVSASSFSGLTFSKASYGRRKRSKLLKSMTSACNIYQNDNKIIDGGATGVQAVSYNLAGIPPSMSGQNINFLYARTVAYNSSPQLPNSTTRGYKLYLDYTEDTTMISNLTVTSCTVDIYDILAKNNVQGVQPDPIVQWNQGLRMDQGTDSVTFPEQIVGSVPYSSPIFTRYSRVIKHTKVEMPPGGCHEHKWTQRIGRSFDLSDTVFTGASSYTSPQEVTNIKGLTHYTLLVIKGVVVAASEGGTAATTSDVRVGVVCTRRTACRLLNYSPRITNFTNTLLNNAAATQTYYNPGSGAFDIGLNEG